MTQKLRLIFLLVLKAESTACDGTYASSVKSKTISYVDFLCILVEFETKYIDKESFEKL